VAARGKHGFPALRHRPTRAPASCRGGRPSRDQAIRYRAPAREATLSNYLLKLYVTGRTRRAEQAIGNLRRICDEDLRGEYELEIIDVLENPQLAEDEKILATPTLIKRLPPPLRRVIGDLSDRDKVLLGLDVLPGRNDLAGRGTK
jgi:circadian clock protein KaiB